MLVLSRKEGERLVIGDNVIITVTRISGNRITLGIEAPRDVRVMRGELERHGSDSEKPAAKVNEKQASHRLPAS
ncbi:MAG: carbon storage regulator, partial [Bdellovibrionales bacterium]|nr:carbon storage regulator [Bdellovibrionales bacterium]